MTIRPFLSAAVLSGTLLLGACNSAQETESPVGAEATGSQIAITGAWSRETAEGQDTGGAFMTIANAGTASDRLTGGASPVADAVQIHTVDMAGGVMRMRQLGDPLDIPAGSSVKLKPGGLHIMLMGLKQPLKRDETFPLTLTFEKAGAVEAEVKVEPITSEGPMGEMAGGHHD
ncbi:hypothetical protein MB02_16350 [Croceicoccus estronivorus]|uniref:copper chaperone PCu(A)C n=1 Tax=Croceicoccus estronivorus TaxID=1172626 RepID=UPI00082AB009|nr:copper chaperone PCu(A)C [Croceicoccus estronivorus]OCC22510.1 hypothetical protein MB02_16350 [Croceicoccus estronivorus]